MNAGDPVWDQIQITDVLWHAVISPVRLSPPYESLKECPNCILPVPHTKLVKQPKKQTVLTSIGTIHRCIDVSRYFSRDLYRDTLCKNRDT